MRTPSSLVPVLGFLVVAGATVSRAAADRLTLSDGRVVEGVVTKDGESYRVVSRFGEAQVPGKDVASWTKEAPFEAEWRRRADATKPDDHAGRAGLAKWLVDAGRAEEGRALAQAVVEVDPENALAHAVLGHIRHKGSFMSPDDARRADGLVQHGETWYTPEEWALLDAEQKARADEEDRAVAQRVLGARVNEAVRLMIAPDAALRAEGEKRLRAIGAETKSPTFAALAAQVRDYAAASDRLVAAAGGGGGGATVPSSSIERATVMAECRIQLAKLKRPIQQFTTGLASNAAGAGVTIQLPEVELIKVGTTVGIPAR